MLTVWYTNENNVHFKKPNNLTASNMSYIVLENNFFFIKGAAVLKFHLRAVKAKTTSTID